MIILGPVAVAQNYVIGNNNALPWHFPEDLARFKKLTLNNTVLMGRKTYESIINQLGKPLPNRKNVIITRQTNYQAASDSLIFNDVFLALRALSNEDIYIIGGEQIFQQILPFCQLAYITHIHDNYEGDAFFPKINWHDWQIITEEKYLKFDCVTYKLPRMIN